MSVYDLNLIREDQVFQGCICLENLALPELIARRQEYLSGPELARYDQIPVDRRRFTFLCGRFAAKKALCRMRPSLDPASFHIAEGVFGQPILPSSPCLNPDFRRDADLVGRRPRQGRYNAPQEGG